MTKEEALEWFKDRKKMNLDDKCQQAEDMAINALDQEPVLDKIRAEIENHCGLIKEDHCRYCSYCNSVMGVREILEVIDKYKESEDI